MRNAMPICYPRFMTGPSLPEFYRRLHTGNPGDVQFYERATQGAQEVLELGCGWGRISVPLLESGAAVTGLDLEPKFIEAAKRSTDHNPRAQFLCQDIRSFSLAAGAESKTFDRIIIPYNTLYSLGGPSGARKCFERAKAHLAPDGELWLDVYPMDAMHAALKAGEDGGEDDDEPVAIQDWDGRPVRIFETSSLDHQTQRLEVIYAAVDDAGACLAELAMTHDYLLFDQIQSLLETAGLSVLGGFGSFHGAPLDEDAEQCIVGACLGAPDH
jgi:precorrin-6B methylase 2